MSDLRKSMFRRIALTAVVCSLVGCGKDIGAIHPAKGRIRESFVQSARTRLANDYPVAMPVTGRVKRITLKPGDRVKKGQTLVEIDRAPFRHSLAEAEARVKELQAEIAVSDDNQLEMTAIREVNAVIQAADKAVAAANAQVSAEKVRLGRAELRAKRYTLLVKQQADMAQSQLDDALAAADTARMELRSQEFNTAAWKAITTAIRLGPIYVNQYLNRKKLSREAVVHQLAQAKARLAEAQRRLGLAVALSPIDGVVLNKYAQGDAPYAAGDLLLRVGRVGDLEVVADVLTRDALKLSVGSRVRLSPGAMPPVRGHVKRIDPAGFTKLSSLGVEQQRVNVIVALDKRPKGLGVGYRLQARFYTGEANDAIIAPRYSVLQAPDGSFYVLKIVDDKLVKQAVELGLRSDLELQIAKGLSVNDLIVSTPDTSMKPGDRVSPPKDIKPWRKAMEMR